MDRVRHTKLSFVVLCRCRSKIKTEEVNCMFIATYSVILLSVIVLIIAVYFFVSQRALYLRGPLRDAAGPALLASAVLIVPYLAFSLAGFLSKREQSSGSAAGSFFSVFAICPAIFIAALI